MRGCSVEQARQDRLDKQVSCMNRMTRYRSGVVTQAKALEVNAFAEIGTGFLLLAMLLTARRSLILCASPNTCLNQTRCHD